jgi:hypothetical protein
MLRRFLRTGIIVLILGSVLSVRIARAEPGGTIQFGPPPQQQTIQLYTPPRPDVSVSQADTSHATLVQAHVLPPDEPVSAQAPAVGKPTGLSVTTETTEATQPSTTTYTMAPVPVSSSGSSETSLPTSSTGGASGRGDSVPLGLVVSAMLAGNCSGMVGLSVNVTDTSGNPMQGAAVAVQIALKTTTQHHDLPPTDAQGNTHATVDVGSPASGFTVTWTVTATSAMGTGSTVVTCVNTT